MSEQITIMIKAEVALEAAIKTEFCEDQPSATPSTTTTVGPALDIHKKNWMSYSYARACRTA